jgi:hypothetical protein
VQVPNAQDWPFAQTFAHWPQLLASLFTSTQAPPHERSGSTQPPWHWPWQGESTRCKIAAGRQWAGRS